MITLCGGVQNNATKYGSHVNTKYSENIVGAMLHKYH